MAGCRWRSDQELQREHIRERIKVARTPREKKLHEQPGPAEEKSLANIAPSKRGRHDAPAMMQRTKACEVEVQYALTMCSLFSSSQSLDEQHWRPGRHSDCRGLEGQRRTSKAPAIAVAPGPPILFSSQLRSEKSEHIIMVRRWSQGIRSRDGQGKFCQKASAHNSVVSAPR